MKASVYHIQVNVSPASVAFYKALLRRLGYTLLDEHSATFGATNGTTDLWIAQTDPSHAGHPFHRKATGINHIAFRVDSRADVDGFTNDCNSSPFPV